MSRDIMRRDRKSLRSHLIGASAWLWPQPQAAVRAGVGAALLAWVWPDAREDDDRFGLGWWPALLAWLWPTAIHDERFGQRHWGPLGAALGWIWPRAADLSLARWWRQSWLWSWMWPGRVMGPDGEVCALAPWHAAVRPEVCPGEPWQRKISRHGGMVFMMFAASAIAAPTLMDTAGGDLLGGRLNLFKGGTAEQPAPSQGGDTGSGGGTDGGGAGDPGAGGSGSGGGSGGGAGGGDGGQPGPTNDFSTPPDAGGDSGATGGPADSGGVTGGDPGTPGGGDPGADPNAPGGGTTFLDPTTTGDGGDLEPDSGLIPGGGSGGGGGGGGPGGGGSGGGGGGGGGGGTDPTPPTGGTDPTPPSGGTNPTPPTGGGPDPFTPPTTPTLPGPDGGFGGTDPTPTDGGTDLTPDPGLLPGGDGGHDPGVHDPDPRDDGHHPGDGGGGIQPIIPSDTSGAPEPGTWGLMILGFGAVGHTLRRRRGVTARS